MTDTDRLNRLARAVEQMFEAPWKVSGDEDEGEYRVAVDDNLPGECVIAAQATQENAAGIALLRTEAEWLIGLAREALTMTKDCREIGCYRRGVR